MTKLRKPVQPQAYTDHLIPGTETTMQRRTQRHEHAPEPRPFVFPVEQVRDVAIALRLGMNIMLTGPTGCGKTALPRALCAELGEPLVRFNCDGETRVSNLRGMNVPDAKDGVLTLRFSPGVLADCMKRGYKVLFDELDAALPSVRFVLQSVLEEDNRTLFIPETGETVSAVDNGFAVFATGNTVGYRAATRSQYAGTTQMNTAFLDRFGMVISCDYPTRAEEFDRVRVNVPECGQDLLDGVTRVAAELRADSKFACDFSTRRCIQWARLIAAYGNTPDDVIRAARSSVLNKLESAVDAKVAKEVICRIFGYEKVA